jgi:hypothetical protein
MSCARKQERWQHQCLEGSIYKGHQKMQHMHWHSQTIHSLQHSMLTSHTHRTLDVTCCAILNLLLALLVPVGE